MLGGHIPYNFSALVSGRSCYSGLGTSKIRQKTEGGGVAPKPVGSFCVGRRRAVRFGASLQWGNDHYGDFTGRAREIPKSVKPPLSDNMVEELRPTVFNMVSLFYVLYHSYDSAHDICRA
jgi:hypothetical protein